MTLTIRPSQLEALQRSALLANLADFTAHAQQFHGQVSDALVRQAVEQAWQFGLRARRDLLAFLDLAVIFGANWSTPETQWLHDGLNNAKFGSHTARLARLRRQAIYRLEAAAIDAHRPETVQV